MQTYECCTCVHGRWTGDYCAYGKTDRRMNAVKVFRVGEWVGAVDMVRQADVRVLYRCSG